MKEIAGRSTRTVDDATFAEFCNFVKTNRGRALTKDERLDVLRLHAHFRHEQETVGDISFHIAKLLGRGKRTVQEVWKDYNDNKTIVVANAPTNTATRKTRIPKTVQVIASVQKFVRDKRQLRARVVAKDVLSHLENTSVINFDKDNKTASETALRSV